VAAGTAAVKGSKHGSSRGKTTPGKVTTRTGGQRGFHTAPFGSSPIVTPRYIYIPAPPTPPGTYVDPNGCQDSGSSCTDRQLCEDWGEDCGTQVPVESRPTDATAATDGN
jgi:hypothetical protein